MTQRQRVEVRDWYQSADTAPACVIMVAPGADLSAGQVRKVNRACHNMPRNVEQYAQDSDGNVRWRVVQG